MNILKIICIYLMIQDMTIGEDQLTMDEITFYSWRARSQSHIIDSGYEVIDDITLARAEMPAIITKTYLTQICHWQRGF